MPIKEKVPHKESHKLKGVCIDDLRRLREVSTRAPPAVYFLVVCQGSDRRSWSGVTVPVPFIPR